MHTLLVAAPLVGVAGGQHVALLTSLQEVSIFDTCTLAAAPARVRQQNNTAGGGGAAVVAPAARLRLRHAVALLALSDSYLAATHGAQVSAVETDAGVPY